MEQGYRIVDQGDSRALAEFLSGEGSALAPLVTLIEDTELAVDDLIATAGRATIEAVLSLSAQQIAGERHPGMEKGNIRRHGRQQGCVQLAERKLRVQRPRLRDKTKKDDAEVPIPAYEAMQAKGVGGRLLHILMRGVSTRNYKEVLPQMAETAGISKSQVSREMQEASEQALKTLCERSLADKDILIIYLDGLIFGGHHVLAALGVDAQGDKHVLGLAEGASENTVVVKGLLEDLVARGVKPGRRRLFVIDGSKALRGGIDAVYGTDNPVQRCRIHKVRNVQGYLPEPLRQQVSAAMKAAFKLEPNAGIAQLEKQAQWLDKECPSAAASLREGLTEMFTVNRLGLPASLRRCLGTTNLIESPNGTVRQIIGRVRRWQNGSMVLRWAASAFLTAEKRFKKIMGHKDLWMLKANLDETTEKEILESPRKVG